MCEHCHGLPYSVEWRVAKKSVVAGKEGDGLIGLTEYVAHRNCKETQTVREHAMGTAKLCEQFAGEFSCGKYGYYMGLYHDLGKYSEAFQKRILNQGARVDHSLSGALVCG